jgi:hypothetical protein
MLGRLTWKKVDFFFGERTEFIRDITEHLEVYHNTLIIEYGYIL